jgi:hypothetical protein
MSFLRRFPDLVVSFVEPIRVLRSSGILVRSGDYPSFCSSQKNRYGTHVLFIWSVCVGQGSSVPVGFRESSCGLAFIAGNWLTAARWSSFKL